MKYINTRWLGSSGGSEGRNGELDKELLKRLAFDMGVNTTDRSNNMRPTLVISYDDSVQEDYTLAFPVHEKHGVPGEINAISSFMLGTGSYLPDDGTQQPLTQNQALEMQEKGWEFCVHGRQHLTIGRYNLRLVSPQGSNRLYISPDYMHRWTHTFPQEITLGRNHAPNITEDNVLIGHGSDENGEYLETENPIKTDQYTFLRLSDNQIEDEIKGCIDELAEMGLYAKHHAAPYSASNWTARRIIRKYLLSARRGRGSTGSPIMIPGSDNVFPTYKLNCFVELTGHTEAELDAWLDEISSVNGMSIMMEHTWRPGFNPDGLDYIIAGALARGMDVTTRTEALKRYGNLLDLGDPFAGEEDNESDQPYFVVDRAGKVFENINDLSDLLDMPH